MKRYGIDAYIEERDAERLLNKILFVMVVAALLWLGILVISEHTEDSMAINLRTTDLEKKLTEDNARLLAALRLSLNKLDAMKEHFGKKWPLDLSPMCAETVARALLKECDRPIILPRLR